MGCDVGYYYGPNPFKDFNYYSMPDRHPEPKYFGPHFSLMNHPRGQYYFEHNINHLIDNNDQVKEIIRQQQEQANKSSLKTFGSVYLSCLIGCLIPEPATAFLTSCCVNITIQCCAGRIASACTCGCCYENQIIKVGERLGKVADLSGYNKKQILILEKKKLLQQKELHDLVRIKKDSVSTLVNFFNNRTPQKQKESKEQASPHCRP